MRTYLTILFIALIALPSSAQQQAEKVELIDLAKDLILTTKVEKNIKQVWWIPSEYWRIALSDTPDIGEGIIADIETQLDGYSLFSIVNSDVTALGGFKPLPATVTIINNDAILSPIEEEEIPAEIKRLLNILKPSLAGMIGQLGEQMNFYVFKNTLEDGTIAISPFNKGELYVKINDADFKYRIPLQSMVEKKICPKDGEHLNGNWDYCPWHGSKLLIKE
jgi:hypothetical protein